MTTDIGAAIDAHIDQEEIVQLMRLLHSSPSFPPGEAEAMGLLQGWLQERGIDAELIDVVDEPGRPDLYYRMPGSGGGKTVMFNGHMDIDPVPLNFEGDPWEFREEDGVVYGHGLINMKAGVAAAAAATVALHRAGISLRGDLLMTAVVGELQGGVGAIDLVQRGLLGDCCIIPEPTGLELLPQHAGAIQFLVHTIGESQWIGAMHTLKSVNAAEKLARIIIALEDLKLQSPVRPEFPGLPRLIVGGINGGVGRHYGHWRASYVPDFATAILEVRGLPEQDYDDIQRQIEDVIKSVAEGDPDFRWEIERPPATNGPEWQSMKVEAYGIDLPPEHYLNQTIVKYHREVRNEEPGWISSNAWNDSGHYTRAGCPSLCYGPGGHTIVREYGVEIKRVIDCTKIIARAAVDIANMDR